MALHVNPLTQQGIQALLKAIIKHSGRALAVQLRLASFAKVDAALLPVMLDPSNPDGTYSLDLARPVHRQIAVELIRCGSPCLMTSTSCGFESASKGLLHIAAAMRTAMCRMAEKHGAGTLRKATLDGVAIDAHEGLQRQARRLPIAGRLQVDFRSQQRPAEDRQALTATEFNAVWTR